MPSPWGTLRSRGKNSLFLVGPVIKCFVKPPNSEERNCNEIIYLMVPCSPNLLQFQGAQHDYVRVKSSRCCFPRSFVSYAHTRELVGFDTQHMT